MFIYGKFGINLPSSVLKFWNLVWIYFDLFLGVGVVDRVQNIFHCFAVNEASNYFICYKTDCPH